MLTEICGFLKNWFDRKADGSDYPKFKGEVTIADGVITKGGVPLLDGQFFRILGSVLNDGVYEYKSAKIEGLRDETFTGEIWSMGVPTDVVALAKEIAEWRALYEKADSAAMSPYQSESFGGYSYSKGSTAGTSGYTPSGWQSVFGPRLMRYKKL